MNKKLQIIPTPYKVDFTGGEKFNIKKVCLLVENGAPLSRALELLCQKANFTFADSDSADLVLSFNTDDDFFNEKIAQEQGYIIKKENNVTYLYAKNLTGLAYGVTTLIQLIGKDIKTLNIYDKPDFKRRGNKWTVWAESGIWSYDFGDGKDAFISRIIRKLDMSLLYKINTIYFDGFGLNLDRFPEYCEVMKAVNDAAYNRGISLITGCYGMSYGQQGHGDSYQGKAYLNRKGYPDGETYSCIGYFDKTKVTPDATLEERIASVFAREHGSCLSNDELFELKATEFETYVKNTHCGGFYLHNVDAHEMHPEIWLSRCDECKKRWPNDDLYAADGAAGAFADYFNKISRRIRAVRDGDWSAKDFVLMPISPGYVDYNYSNDETYNMSIKFWSAVSKYLDKENIAPCFREQFIYQEKDGLRCEYLNKVGMQTDTAVINFGASDGFYGDKLFTLISLFNYMMKDFSYMLMANGNAYQEPLQVFNAEYTWRVEGSSFYELKEKPTDAKTCMDLYKDVVLAHYRPEEIYGNDGMIDVICEKLYGKTVGAKMAEIYKLRGSNDEAPVPMACSVEIFTNYNRIIMVMRWDNENFTETDIAEKKQRFSECAKLSALARDITKDVLNGEIENADTRADIAWLCEGFSFGTELCEMLHEYMIIFEKLHKAFIDGT
ncbi:MAG: hypothetical protein J6S00_03245, partial [Clostridia bacterium]|nr:hypothetical protein [Clostridia bacterium]